jgi:hypothetical protein
MFESGCDAESLRDVLWNLAKLSPSSSPTYSFDASSRPDPGSPEEPMLRSKAPSKLNESVPSRPNLSDRDLRKIHNCQECSVRLRRIDVEHQTHQSKIEVKPCFVKLVRLSQEASDKHEASPADASDEESSVEEIQYASSDISDSNSQRDVESSEQGINYE